ncbi:MAG: ATP-binding protein [Cytophaga sp.]|uniref:ATP-binding protein n=1 Tax=Cytophaga sp. TaxID=29535 RepID=UPI003F7DB56F
MLLRNIPIRRKLMIAIMLTSGAVLALTCTAFCSYEFYTFRQATVRQLSTLGEMIAANSTAALAFDDSEDAKEILTALKADQHIAAASLYDKDGNLFSYYPANLSNADFPAHAGSEGYYFSESYLEGFQPVFEGSRKLGSLYLKYDLIAMNERFKLYGIIAFIVIGVSSLLAYSLSKILQRSISKPIVALAETAKTISEHKDHSVRAVKFGSDELGSLTDAFNDMLTQIQMQNQTLNEFNQKLEQKVAERTTELESVNKELESFSYSVSHDLRAPLRFIHGYTNILEEEYKDKFDDEGRTLIQRIVNNTKKMGQLIDDLLSFSQLGRKEIRKRLVSMNTIVREVWEELMRMESGRNVKFVMQELPDVYVDPSTINQVWVNLISNALKYSKNREQTVIEISYKQTEKETVFIIKDNGAGFDMQYYDKLFGVFQRLHSTKEFEGTGVGLAIIQRIIAKHGGKIWAEAEVNKGATFYFSLPIN